MFSLSSLALSARSRPLIRARVHLHEISGPDLAQISPGVQGGQPRRKLTLPNVGWDDT